MRVFCAVTYISREMLVIYYLARTRARNLAIRLYRSVYLVKIYACFFTGDAILTGNSFIFA